MRIEWDKDSNVEMGRGTVTGRGINGARNGMEKE